MLFFVHILAITKYVEGIFETSQRAKYTDIGILQFSFIEKMT